MKNTHLLALNVEADTHFNPDTHITNVHLFTYFTGKCQNGSQATATHFSVCVCVSVSLCIGVISLN